jgi:hypothetical protein
LSKRPSPSAVSPENVTRELSENLWNFRCSIDIPCPDRDHNSPLYAVNEIENCYSLSLPKEKR